MPSRNPPSGARFPGQTPGIYITLACARRIILVRACLARARWGVRDCADPATVPAAPGSRVASSSNEAMLPGVLKLPGPPSPCPSLTEGEKGVHFRRDTKELMRVIVSSISNSGHWSSAHTSMRARQRSWRCRFTRRRLERMNQSLGRKPPFAAPGWEQRFSVEIGAGWFNQHVRICAGGAQQCASLRQPRIPARPVDEPGGKPLNMARPNRNLDVAYPGLRVRLVISSRARDFTHARSIVHFVHICPPIAFSFPWQNNPPKTDAGRSSRCGRRPGRHREERRASLGLRRETARTHEGKDAANLAKRGADGSQRASNAGQKASGASQRASSVQTEFPVQWVRPVGVAPETPPGNRHSNLLNLVDGSLRALNETPPDSTEWSGFRDVALDRGNGINPSTARGSLRARTLTRDPF